MAKINKYWGLVAVGAATAAAAGAIAAIVMKKKPVNDTMEFEDDFDMDFETPENKTAEASETSEDFASWEEAVEEAAQAEAENETPAEEPAEEAEAPAEEKTEE